ncbi:cob(I)yrinic acid a,c-diamide adenosyltransferase [Propionicicella superfundia]|uniref:cob(I)yrinic acid a,c-diamide adenosyltransferase n=1 Tax=Propionicicella superfundia TaxID=348582 RepID=UPI00041DBE29|nr:cob(I)yrinic acid a,c-diamide adenosyltransferase [Propionicicella superfundia]
MPEPTTPADPAGTTSVRQERLRPALIVNTGDGKGKTTAAMGLALRAWRQGWPIVVYQFVKSAQWPTGERTALEALGAEHERTGQGAPVEWHAIGAGRRRTHRPGATDAQADAARAAWASVRERLAAERHRLYVLDEFTYPLNWGWLDLGEVVATLRDRPGCQHIVITGRAAPAELLGIATTVTEMGKVKHPFDTGQRGQAGIEW